MTTKTERIALRASERERLLLEVASQVAGVTMTEFVLTHAVRAAADVLADRRIFVLDDEAWGAFDRALDQPAAAVSGLRDLMRTPTVLDED